MQDLPAKASSHDFGSLAQHGCLPGRGGTRLPVLPAGHCCPQCHHPHCLLLCCRTAGTSAPLGPQGHLLLGTLRSPTVETMLVPALWAPQPHGGSDRPLRSSADRQISLHCHRCLPTTSSQSAQYGGCPTPPGGPRAAAMRALQMLWGTLSCLGAAGCYTGTGRCMALLLPCHRRVGHVPLEGDG